MHIFNMGGYGAYIWSAYGFVFLTLLWSGFQCIARGKRIWRALSLAFGKSSSL